MRLSSEALKMYETLRKRGLLSQQTFDELTGAVEKSHSITAEWKKGSWFSPAASNQKKSNWDEETI